MTDRRTMEATMYVTHLYGSFKVWPGPSQIKQGDDREHDFELYPERRVLHKLGHCRYQRVTHGDNALERKNKSTCQLPIKLDYCR